VYVSDFLSVRFSKARIQLLQSRCIKESQYPKIMAVFVHNIIHAELIELIEAECNCYNPTAQMGLQHRDPKQSDRRYNGQGQGYRQGQG